MATKLDNWAFKGIRRMTKSAASFDFALDGKIWKLVQGDDFKTSPAAIRNLLYERGRKLKKLVHTQLVENGVVVQAENGTRPYHRRTATR